MNIEGLTIKLKRILNSVEENIINTVVGKSNHLSGLINNLNSQVSGISGGGIKSVQYGVIENNRRTTVNHAPVNVSKSFIIFNGSWHDDVSENYSFYLKSRSNDSFTIDVICHRYHGEPAIRNGYISWQLIEFN